MHSLVFDPPIESPEIDGLREEVRSFLADHLAGRKSYQYLGKWDPEFSGMLADRGWIGMTWPTQYGGQEKSLLERYAVSEELLAAHAPLQAHWIGDRQSGPLLLRYGSEELRQKILPGIAAGRNFFCIGMSEPDSGSDLASVRTKAVKVDGGYVLNGAKIWTSNAHRADFMIVFCRTSAWTEHRHEGLSQLLIDMQSPGIQCRQITNMAGDREFNEVFFKDVYVPDNMLVGREGEGWTQVTNELAYERGGPERFLSTFGLLRELVASLHPGSSDSAIKSAGRLIARVAVARRLSRSVAAMLHAGSVPMLQASLLKDLGSNLEQEICEVVREVANTEPALENDFGIANALAETLLRVPSSTIRGGTKEVLRGIIARGIGLR